jgi:hypothetical protein
MKKQLFLTIILFTFIAGVLPGQSFDWNIRGGLNIMNGQPSDKEVSLQYHAGLQLGVRITNLGIYGEAVYSMHENQNGGDPVAYFLPAIVIKRYIRDFLFVEFGGAFLAKVGDSGVVTVEMNPNNTPLFLAGLGTGFSKFELSLRTVAKQSYGVIQVTAAVKF